MAKQKFVGRKWVLVTENGLFPSNEGSAFDYTLTDDIGKTNVFDSRDNKRIKTQHASACFGEYLLVRFID